MAYPDELLAGNEQVVVHKHPHWKMLVFPVLAFLITVAVGAYLAALVADLDNESWRLPLWVAIGAVCLALIVWLTLIPLIRWRTTHFVVTTQRVLVREGVLHRSGIDIPLARVNSVQFRHTLTDRILGCGTLIIESASEKPLEFDDIPRVERVHSLLYQELHAEVSDDDDEPAEPPAR